MTIQEAKDVVSLHTSKNQTIFISVKVAWYDHVDNPVIPSIEYRLSLVPGFHSCCDQFNSDVSLEHCVNGFLLAVKENSTPKSQIQDAETLLEESTKL